MMTFDAGFQRETVAGQPPVCCSANYLDQVDVVNLTPEQQVFIKEIPDPMFRQTVRDFMVNQQFRKDYWVKGARRLSALEQMEALRNVRLVLTTPRADVSLKVTGAVGEATMSEAIYNPILDALADHRIHSIGQLEQALKDRNITFGLIVEAMLLLTGAGHLQLAQDEQASSKARKSCERLNQYLMVKARSSNDVSYLASPVTGGGIAVNRFQQLFLLARSQGHKQPAEWAQSAWQILSAQGQTLIKDGKGLPTPEENLAELTAQAKTFAERQLPILKSLQIA